MKLARVSNAGLFVETKGLRFLFDGLHGGMVPPYCGMDPAWEAYLFGPAPAADILAFTHAHADHFDPGRTARYLADHPKTRVYAGPDVLAVLGSLGVKASRLLSWEEPGPLGLSSFPARHIGPQFRDTPHRTLVLQGDRTLLFTGDASPVKSSFSAPCGAFRTDILAAPFPFVLGNAPFRIIRDLIRPEAVCILHLPLPGADPSCFRARAHKGAASLPMSVWLMELGETLVLA